MRLTVQQAYALFEKYTCYVTEACNTCGKPLGPVRWTIKGQEGVYCSQKCRGKS